MVLVLTWPSASVTLSWKTMVPPAGAMTAVASGLDAFRMVDRAPDSCVHSQAAMAPPSGAPLVRPSSPMEVPGAAVATGTMTETGLATCSRAPLASSRPAPHALALQLQGAANVRRQLASDALTGNARAPARMRPATCAGVWPG